MDCTVVPNLISISSSDPADSESHPGATPWARHYFWTSGCTLNKSLYIQPLLLQNNSLINSQCPVQWFFVRALLSAHVTICVLHYSLALGCKTSGWPSLCRLHKREGPVFSFIFLDQACKQLHFIHRLHHHQHYCTTSSSTHCTTRLASGQLHIWHQYDHNRPTATILYLHTFSLIQCRIKPPSVTLKKPPSLHGPSSPPQLSSPRTFHRTGQCWGSIPTAHPSISKYCRGVKRFSAEGSRGFLYDLRMTVGSMDLFWRFRLCNMEFRIGSI